MRHLLLALGLISIGAQAAPKQFVIDTKLYVDGKYVAGPRVVVDSGKEAEISDSSRNQKLNIKIRASEMSSKEVKDGILVKLAVNYVSGVRTVKVSPQILARNGSESVLDFADGSRGQDVTLKVIATRSVQLVR